MIYMEDDYFIGTSLKKSDFFYYDRKEKKVLPYVLAQSYSELNKNQSLSSYESVLKRKETFKPQDANVWYLSVLSTEKYFIETFNITIINTMFTHNARAQNLDDLKDMFESIQNYKYIKETLYSKTRHLLTLNQPYYDNLFQLNIKHRKVNILPFRHVEMEDASVDKLYISLFVINTCGNNRPTIEQYENEKKVMSERFPNPIKYEIKSEKV